MGLGELGTPLVHSHDALALVLALYADECGLYDFEVAKGHGVEHHVVRVGEDIIGRHHLDGDPLERLRRDDAEERGQGLRITRVEGVRVPEARDRNLELLPGREGYLHLSLQAHEEARHMCSERVGVRRQIDANVIAAGSGTQPAIDESVSIPVRADKQEIIGGRNGSSSLLEARFAEEDIQRPLIFERKDGPGRIGSIKVHVVIESPNLDCGILGLNWKNEE